jgi:hypothetical protein
MFRNVFPSAVTLAEEAQRGASLALLLLQIAREGFPHQRGKRDSSSTRQGVKLVVERFVDEDCSPPHMTYSSIYRAVRKRPIEESTIG